MAPIKSSELRKLREERDYWFMQARMSTRSLRATINRAEQADKEYQEALKQQPVKHPNQNKRSNRITNIP